MRSAALPLRLRKGEPGSAGSGISIGFRLRAIRAEYSQAEPISVKTMMSTFVRDLEQSGNPIEHDNKIRATRMDYAVASFRVVAPCGRSGR